MRESTPKQEKLDTIIGSDFQIMRGSPRPFGSEIRENGINFALLSKHATAVTLVIYLPMENESVLELPFDPRFNKTGDIWHMFIQGISREIRYGYRVDRQPNLQPLVHRYQPEIVLLDPYAKAYTGAPEWGQLYRRNGENGTPPTRNHRRSIVVNDAFDWEYDQPLNLPLHDAVIYEMHVRGFTIDPSSGVAHPGTYRGVIEKIPYLKELGVTAVELLPINEFDEMDSDRFHPDSGTPLLNFWGYNTIGFFAPKASYASRNRDSDPVREFKEMVKALHKAGIEVILDIVFNHTGEGDERGTTYSFRGLDNSIYYIIDPVTGMYHNYSGCGNTVNCNHPNVRDLILECLHYWVTEMHVDGFRFDLAAILGRGRDGSVLADPPLIERIAHDPILANTKLIAEAWDAAGLYQVGRFPAWGRWAEWNGHFRDDVRRFLRGEDGLVSALATRLSGSADLYQGSGRAPYHSINFITSHDGFTLRDLVSYNEKHNWENGEENRDGSDANFSWNCGEEGPSDDPEINALRRRQMKNHAALLLLSHGVPMILAGDEFGRTQGGNNNAYCHDNPISWINWQPTRESQDLLRFFKRLIEFRKQHPNLRRSSFDYHPGENHPHIRWHGIQANQPDWSEHSRSLALELYGNPADRDIYIIVNAYHGPLTFQLPRLLFRQQWLRVLDTAFDAPRDIVEPGREERRPDPSRYSAAPRSVVVLIAG